MKYQDIENISLEDFHKIENLTTTHVFKPEQIIFYKDHIPYGVFILLEGEIEIKGKNKKISRANSPIILGYSSFVNKGTYQFTAKAVTLCKINFISGSLYDKLLSDSKGLNWLIKAKA